MLRARVTAQLSGQSSRLKPIAADERMTQPVGVNRDGTLSTYPPVYPVLTVNGKTGEVRLAAKDVGALPAETRIPQNTSDLNNDSGFIGRLTADLENYYRKSETYTREEIDDRISLIPKFKISVVEALPTENISGTTVYLLKAGNTSGDLYTEYIFTGGAWEILGSQRVDLTGYAKETWVSDLLKGYAKQTEFDALVSRTIPTYVLAEGETPEDAPEWADEVIDPYNDPEGGGYVLTDEDKQEIAEIAAGMVDVPGGGETGGEKPWVTLVDETFTEDVQIINVKNETPINELMVILIGRINTAEDTITSGQEKLSIRFVTDVITSIYSAGVAVTTRQMNLMSYYHIRRVGEVFEAVGTTEAGYGIKAQGINFVAHTEALDSLRGIYAQTNNYIKAGSKLKILVR